MAVSAPLVFKQTAAEGALERQLVAVDLLVSLQVAQAAERDQQQRLLCYCSNTYSDLTKAPCQSNWMYQTSLQSVGWKRTLARTEWVIQRMMMMMTVCA